MRNTRFTVFMLALVCLGGVARSGSRAAVVHGEQSGLRGRRYCEILVVRRRFRAVDAAVYNTIGLNDCPAAAWAKIDTTTLARQFKADAVLANGPRYFMMDASSYTVPGDLATFDGLAMRLVARIAVPPGRFLPWKRRESYTETIVRRTTLWTYFAGRPTYRLSAPNGKTYVMQSYAHIIEQGQTQASLPSLSAGLRLPVGWRFHVVTPRATLELRSIEGSARIVQDDLENTYQRLD